MATSKRDSLVFQIRPLLFSLFIQSRPWCAEQSNVIIVMDVFSTILQIRYIIFWHPKLLLRHRYRPSAILN